MATGKMLDGGRFCFNVDSHVGPGCPNKTDDVQLVQFGYYCMTRSNYAPFGLTPAEMAIIKTVVPGAPYTGSPTDPLTLSIKAHQRARGGTQDGRVSPFTNASGFYGEQTWMIISLVVNIIIVYSELYPRLDKAPNCPPVLAATVRRMFSKE
jgi:hypothetical protein